MGKRILFYTYYECDPEKGGTERTTYILADQLRKELGSECMFAYKIKRDKMHDSNDGASGNSMQLRNASCQGIEKLLNAFNPDIIIIQGQPTVVRSFKKGILHSGKDIKLIYAHHYAPGAFERMYISPKELWKGVVNSPHSPKKLALLMTYPLSMPFYKSYMRRQYRNVTIHADRTVLLSKSYIDEWIDNGAPEHLRHKIIYIPNALVFEGFATEEQINKKGKRALIVARMHEGQKKISKALEIWKKICEDSKLDEWSLDIVGDGPDRHSYEEWVRKNNLKRVIFHGFQPPLEFYRKSSIFMMTSAFEGFAMTLLEACQTGAVPMAFDSFSSLRDIVENHKNGIIIPCEDIQKYVSELKNLMTDDALRRNMAMASVDKSRGYSIDRITKKWTELFEEILSDK